MTIDTTNLCSHLHKKLFEEEGVYHRLWLALQDDPELTAVVRSRQLHIYRNSKKVLVLAGKSANRIKASGEIDDAISQIGGIIVVDADYALDLLRVSKKYRNTSLRKSKK